MREPSRRTSRQVLALGLIAATAIGAGGFLLGRATSPRPAPRVAIAPAPSPLPPRMPPVAERRGTLGRSDLIALAEQAADAAASGRPLPETVLAVQGRRFELRLAFGCKGPAVEGAESSAWWRYDPAEQALRLHAAPLSFAPDEWLQGSPKGIEAVEGFWVARPWTSNESCPKAPALASETSDPITFPGQTLAVAEILTEDAPRPALRKDQAFEAVRRVAPEELNSAAGYVLRLRGRVSRTPSLGPVRCRQPGGPEQRPICMILVDLDEVAFASTDGDRTYATWPSQDASVR